MIALEILGIVCLLIGSTFSVIGGVGIVRLPDFYSRLHGAGVTDTMGAGMILLGLALVSGSFLVAFKVGVIWFFLTVTSPSSSHALARSAITHGLRPCLDVRPSTRTDRRDATMPMDLDAEVKP